MFVGLSFENLLKPGIIIGMLTVALVGCSGGCENQASKRVATEATVAAPPADVPPATESNKIAIDTNAATKEALGLDQTLPVAGLVTSSVHGVDAKTAGTLAIEVKLKEALLADAVYDMSGELLDSFVETDGYSLASTEACGSGTYTAKLVGSGYEVVKNASYSNGIFTLEGVPTKNEAILELSCGMRCLVQAGQRGVLCNQIADSVLDAFEIALGKSVYDSSFSGAKLAKVMSAIVDASQIKGDETESFKTGIATCSADFDGSAEAECFQKAIKNSPFYPAFKILEQLAQGWTPEGLYSFVTTVLGAKVRVDSELYGWILDAVEKALETNFVTETRKLLANVVRSQNANESKYPFQVVCVLEINGSDKRFKPDLSSGDKLTCDKAQAATILTSAGIASSYHEAILSDQQRESVPCTAADAFTDQSGQKRCWARLGMSVESVVQEVDRNDPTGTRRKPPTRAIDMVDVMPQVMMDMQQAKLPLGDNMNFEQFTAEQKAKIAEIIAKRKDFFLGLIGLYRMLNDKELRGIKLSLKDLHEIFADKRFLNSRLVGWGPGLSGVQVTNPSRPSESRYLDPLIYPLSANDQAMGVSDQFRFNPSQGFQQKQIDINQAQSLLQQATLSFKHTFDMFTKIPNSREVERFIFDASRHEEWNPIGSRFLYVAQLRDTGKPLFCRMKDHGPNFTMTSSTKIECDGDPSQVTCGGTLEEGQCKVPTNYSFPFILMERGWFGEDVGRLFMLSSRTNGRPIGASGGQSEGIMLREVKSGNATGECDLSQVGKVVQYISKFQCGDNKTCQQNVNAYCMDFSSFGKPARKRFYPGGTHKVTFINTQTGETSTWDVPRIGVHTVGTDHSTNTSACLHVPTGSFIASGAENSQLVTLRVSNTGELNLTGLTSAAIKDCSESAQSGFEKYILYNYRDFASHENGFAYLMSTRNETLVWSQNPVTDNQWDKNYARLPVAAIELLLNGKKVMGSAQTNIEGMRFINPAHDPKYDPYCDDINGNGLCDCYPVENISADGQEVTFSSVMRPNPALCGLRDKAAEPTIAQLPYCSTCGDGAKAAQFFEAYGGKSGSGLASANTFFGNSWPPFDVNSAAFCLYRFAGEQKFRSPNWVDFRNLGGPQKGCPQSEGATRTAEMSGPIRIINPKPMNNAYLIDRPRQVLQLANYALKSVGQGVTLSPESAQFTADEAYAFLQLRLLMPLENLSIQDSQGRKLKDVSVLFRSVDVGDESNDVISGALKGILFKGGRLSDQDLSVKRPTENK